MCKYFVTRCEGFVSLLYLDTTYIAPMANYLPYIFGLASLLGGLFLFLLSFRIYKPKHKTEIQKNRYRKWLEKYGTAIKICSIILILNGSYDLIKRDPNRYKIEGVDKKSEWTSEDREILIRNCIRDAGPTGPMYPQITEEYCACSMDKIMKAMSKEQYEKTLLKPVAEQIKEVLPIFQDCLTVMKQRMDSVDNKSK